MMSLRKTVSIVYDLLDRTLQSGERELRLVESREFYPNPREQFAVTQVR